MARSLGSGHQRPAAMPFLASAAAARNGEASVKTTMKSRVQRLGLIGFTFGVGLTLSTRDLGAQTQIANLRTAVEEAGTVQNQTTSNQTLQDQKIQQLQDKLEEIQKQLMELKQANAVAPETHHTTTAKASVTSSDLSDAEPEITDP